MQLVRRKGELRVLGKNEAVRLLLEGSRETKGSKTRSITFYDRICTRARNLRLAGTQRLLAGNHHLEELSDGHGTFGKRA
jgi:hypothetical protein